MKLKWIFPIIILIFIYTIAIKDTATLYYIPGANFSIFVRSLAAYLLPYVALSEALILFLPALLSTSVTLITSYKKSPPIKIPFSTIVMISAIPPILVIINNYTSGIFSYSVLLLIYAFIVTVLSSWTFFAGKEYPHPSKEDINNRKMIEGVNAFIMEIDSFRLPVVVGISPYPFRIRFGLFSKQGQKLFFARNNPDLYQKIQENMDPFLQEGIYSNLLNPSPDEYILRYSLRYNLNYQRMAKLKGNSSFNRYRFAQMDTGFSFISCMGISLLIILLGIRLMSFLGVVNQDYLFLLVINPLILYLAFAILSTGRRHVAGKKYENDLKMVVQELIDFGIKLIREEELDPRDFSVKLRHNDYKSLFYEKKGENEYIAHFKKD